MATFVNESDPVAEMRKLLVTHWKGFRETNMPQILVANDPEDPRVRADLNFGDVIVIRQDGLEQLRQRYNFTYYDRIFPMQIEIYTKQSRQRMRNLGKMVRAIINDNIHSFPSYQLIRYRGQDEAIEDNLNIWRARFRFQLESNAVCVETLE